MLQETLKDAGELVKPSSVAGGSVNKLLDLGVGLGEVPVELF